MNHTEYLSRKDIGQFSAGDLDMVYKQEALHDFIGLPFDLDNIVKQVQLKEESYPETHRKIIHEALHSDYKSMNHNEIALKQIESLKNRNTFTITTGHQLCLLGGPLFFFLKVIHIIKLSQELNTRFPNHHFVPLFWMASEDHDSKEIDHVHLFGKTFTWEHNQSGAVGRFTTNDLAPVLDQIASLFPDKTKEELQKLHSSFNGSTYAEAFRNWMHHLFSEKGLLVLDPDKKELKELFRPFIKRELLESFSDQRIKETNLELKAQNRPIQLFTREINLFYLDENTRSRIRKEGERYVLGEKKLNQAELIERLEQEIDRFSPNVALRPLYQETILPNLLYVGGMAELNYWMQLKKVFEGASLPFPMLQMRSNLLWIDKNAARRMKELDIAVQDIFKDAELLKKQLLSRTDPDSIDDDSIEKALAEIKKSMENGLQSQKGMEKWLEAEMKELHKGISRMKNKILKEKKKKHDQSLQQIDRMKEKLFPTGKLQERYQNLLHFCNTKGVLPRLEELMDSIDPLRTDFTILIEGQNESE